MLTLFKSSVFRKILMAISGQLMILFVIVHMLGNSTIYAGWLNTYADHLHALPLLIWIFRVVMLTVLAVHILFGILLTLENRGARPRAYAVKKTIRASFASKNMIWTGTVIAAFLAFHLLHFTIQSINPEFSAKLNSDLMGRPDVLKMLVINFQDFSISIIYGIALIAVLLHLIHGIQSSFQSLGLSSDGTLPVIEKTGSVAAIIIFIGYISIPIVILAGIVKG
jgi:succinate dehydrogenase / fumarate reductase cytochrome b subunit